jgi:plastocyanin
MHRGGDGVRSCEKEKNLKPSDTYTLRRARAWFGLLLVVVGALLLLAACGSSTTPTPAPGSTQMLMINNESNGSFGFSPATLTIKKGTTVIWKNVSLAPHTVTSDDGQTFDSGTVAVGNTFKFTFKTAGTFSYHCNIHPYMRATIVVV